MTEVPCKLSTTPPAENKIFCSLEHGTNIAEMTGYYHWQYSAV
jgi:hypothetical protein